LNPLGLQGVIVYFRVVDGELKVGDVVKLMNTGKEYQVDELGVLAPKPVQVRHSSTLHYRHFLRPWGLQAVGRDVALHNEHPCAEQWMSVGLGVCELHGWSIGAPLQMFGRDMV
jgi:transketolase N-terminal domain/subunit